MKVFQESELNLILFNSADVITTSGNPITGTDPIIGEPPDTEP